MSKAEPTVQKYMTCQPHSIEESALLKDAVKIMSDHQIRHLPVTREGDVVGILSDRDVKSALAILGGTEGNEKVGDVSHGDPFAVSPDSKLHEVADEMATHHIGSAVVMQNHKLVGIFTAVDACRALSEVLQQRFHEHL